MPVSRLGLWLLGICIIISGCQTFVGKVSAPYPANEAVDVPVNTILVWSKLTDTTSYDVYFGTDNPP